MMVRPISRLALISLATWYVSCAVADSPDAVIPAEQAAFFEREIRPLLVRHCYECHRAGASEVGGGLQLDSRLAVLRGGESGPALVPGDPAASRLIQAVRYKDPLLQMPPAGKLAEREIALLEEWVRRGAPDPRSESPTSRGSLVPASDSQEDASRETWWSFQPLTTAGVPTVANGSWPSSDVDRFVLRALEDEQMVPAPEAERRVLIRRVTYDLTGLPPTPDEIDTFVADEAPDAFARLIDRLLASPAYGERWGRHWLDVVRYADTSGCNGDFPVPDAFRYRNYVIDSFNADKSYERFVWEQLAGDLLPAASDEARFEQQIATGYLAISRRFSSLGEEFHLTLDDTIDNFGKAFCGLTISCARCHDHKFDPVPQTDYYALYGIFQSTKYAFPGTEIYRHRQDFTPLVSQQRLEGGLRAALADMARLDASIFATYSSMAQKDTGKEKDQLRAQWKSMQQERDKIIQQLPDFDRAYGATEGIPTNARLHRKGDPNQLGPEVPRGFLGALGSGRLPDGDGGSGRRQLAEWLTTQAQPLTARVIVNRIWLHHFGRGLVRTPDDFGTRGERPTHPELLDYLARELVASGWSVKSLHRRILLSRIYQTACIERPEFQERDPDNRWLWTFLRRRLSAEEIRDAMYLVSGTLDLTRGGAHPFPAEWEWRYSQHRPFVDDYPSQRRSVYLMQQRIRQQPFLAIFDGADANTTTGLRKVSTVAPQALFMMNSELVHEQAAAFAQRLESDAATPRARIRLAYRLAFGRPPDASELREALAYLDDLQTDDGALGELPPEARGRAAWHSLLRVLLSSNEFLFVD